MSEFNLSAWALKNRSIIVYLMLVMTAAGVIAYFRLGRSEDPSFIIKTMVVQAAWPGASVDDTLKQVTERLERKLQETPKLDFLRSFTSAGRTTIFVNLLGSTTAEAVPAPHSAHNTINIPTSLRIASKLVRWRAECAWIFVHDDHVRRRASARAQRKSRCAASSTRKVPVSGQARSACPVAK